MVAKRPFGKRVHAEDMERFLPGGSEGLDERGDIAHPREAQGCVDFVVDSGGRADDLMRGLTGDGAGSSGGMFLNSSGIAG